MINRTAIAFLLLLTAAVAHATTFVNTDLVYPVPVIPHGLDWGLIVIPEHKIEMKILSADEIQQILPPALKLGRIEEALTLGPASQNDVSPIQTLIAIFTGTFLLLMAYRLIPHAHSKVSRIRSINLPRDLFS